jgi:hypothetical protein
MASKPLGLFWIAGSPFSWRVSCRVCFFEER